MTRGERAANQPQSPAAFRFRWWPTIVFWASMHLLLGFWLFGRSEKPVWSPVSSSLFLLLAAVLIFFISWMLGAFRLPRQIVLPIIVLTSGIVLTSIQEGFFPQTATSNPVWRTALQVVLVAGFVWIMVFNVQAMLLRFKSQHRLANQDNLTGLFNRTGMQRALHHLTPQQKAVLIMMDLNDLKSINDLSGHDAGDQHIQAVAQAITEALPKDAAASRWGGDEFLVILLDSSVAQADHFAQTVIKHSPKVRLTLPALAFGAALVHSYDDLQRAIAVADQRMYENKENVKHTHLDTTLQHVPSAEEFMRLIEGLNSTQELLRRGLENLRLILGFDASSYYELLGTSLQSVYISSTHEQQEAPLHSLKRDVSSGLLGQAMVTNSTIGTADYPSEARAMPEWVAMGLRSLLATPVRDAGSVVGVLVLMSYHNWRPITPHARRLLEAVALRLGYILEHERVLKQVELTVEGGLMALGAALEARDVESFGHTQRVVAYAEHLGAALGLPRAALIELKQGAYLHDIGKLMVPDALLRKPARLTPEEFKTMQQHAEQGFALASRIPNLSQGALDIILYHHENWDGGGYPSGRVGSQIPLLARIFTVCDVYEALISVRPYKPAWPVDVALSEIEAQAGKKFDPQVVAAFLKLMRS
ncbi:diguanylate cyclase (plasmid) [Deinococcus psychrotolerans]|uniref:Diguanylate cyclase n=1 Tax=Deinococcus psychrotolerans TaxID=2489213 RepID=A0A3G8YHS7_9DEIO|nr:HD domain-containing phosphohydrolase [Deinococcus psychrotolerans]AZI44849.1 diguanylate cyclase [Deinococcus psychrotolerans]